MTDSRAGAHWRRARVGLGLYLLALVFSHLYVIARGPTGTTLAPDDRVLELAANDGTPVRLVYRDHPARSGADAPALVLLHGSPGSLQDFAGLARVLGDRYRVVVPDLPGFGKSSRDLPDYSARAHARYVIALLEDLGIDRAHLVAFSMGGAVAGHIAALAPERTASIAMVAALGVQELELFGDYRTNHLVHGLQLRLVQAARWLTPHMGLLDAGQVGLPYARNFYDTDQRPLRAILLAYQEPMLILHGARDPLVPLAAALEHHRIVPQSSLHTYDDGHLLLWRRPAEIASQLGAFVDAVEGRTANTRATADPARAAAAARPFDPRDVPAAQGIALLLLLGLLALATLVSEDLTCITAGLLVADGRLGFGAATAACLAGIFIGDLLLFAAGRLLGRPALALTPLGRTRADAVLSRTSAWFARRGMAVIFLTRFIPGTRLPTYVAAGVLRTPFLSFAGYFLLAAIAWTPALVGFAAWSGRRADELLSLFSGRDLAAVGLFAVSLLVVERVALRLATHAGRRRLVGRVRRWSRWEFWPRSLVYPPVVAWVIALALRHRSLTVVTAVNPSIPLGGLVGESKGDILDRIGRHDLVARYARLRVTDPVPVRQASAERLVGRGGDGLPVVLKPDVGERGHRVRVIREPEALARELADLTEDTILQEYVPGVELGVFYVRRPGADSGEIFSITDKVLPEVTGDGRRTLGRLILDDPRAVVLADHYRAVNAHRIDVVPAAGEPVRLVELGTHSLGAVFLDGKRLRSDELERLFDDLSRSLDGFHFGRYDVRAPSYEEFQKGVGIRVLELNGLTSEATHIYDPAVSLREAYRTLFEQWRLAFAIGADNRDRGATPATLGEVVRALCAAVRR